MEAKKKKGFHRIAMVHKSFTTCFTGKLRTILWVQKVSWAFNILRFIIDLKKNFIGISTPFSRLFTFYLILCHHSHIFPLCPTMSQSSISQISVVYVDSKMVTMWSFNRVRMRWIFWYFSCSGTIIGTVYLGISWAFTT